MNTANHNSPVSKTGVRHFNETKDSSARVSQRGTSYYPWFDWLRITLAMTVFLSHVGAFRWHNAGHLAVQVFFALSGWLIGGVLLETSVNDVPRFYFNRATRIWVPYAIAIGLLLSVSIFRDTITPKYLEFVLYKLTFVYNFFGPPQLSSARFMPLQGTANHFWSICVEEQFYLFSPILLVFARKKLGRSALVWGLLTFCAIALDAYGAICAGVFAIVLRKRYGCWHKSQIAKGFLILLVIATAAMMHFDAWRYEYVSPVFAISVVLLLAEEGTKSKLGGVLGGMSYPLYLNQWIGAFAAHFLLRRLGMRNSIWAPVLTIVLGTAFCAFLYVIVDRQVLARRSSWYSRRLGWTLTTVGYALVVVGLITGAYLTHHG